MTTFLLKVEYFNALVKLFSVKALKSSCYILQIYFCFYALLDRVDGKWN